MHKPLDAVAAHVAADQAMQQASIALRAEHRVILRRLKNLAYLLMDAIPHLAEWPDKPEWWNDELYSVIAGALPDHVLLSHLYLDEDDPPFFYLHREPYGEGGAAWYTLAVDHPRAFLPHWKWQETALAGR